MAFGMIDAGAMILVITGVLGLFGIHVVPKKYRGKDCEKEYIRFRSIFELILGIPFLAFGVALHFLDPDVLLPYILGIFIVLALPAVIYDRIAGKKFEDM